MIEANRSDDITIFVLRQKILTQEENKSDSEYEMSGASFTHLC